MKTVICPAEICFSFSIFFLCLSSTSSSDQGNLQQSQRQRRRSGGAFQSATVRFPSGRRLAAVNSRDRRYSDPFAGGGLLFSRRDVEAAFMSRHFQVFQLAARNGAPLFRLSPSLVECLERVQLASPAGRPITVTRAYRARDGSSLDGPRHREERLHVSGTAADLRYERVQGGLLSLATLVLEECAPLFRGYGSDIGIGLGKDIIHVDIRGAFVTWVLPGAAMTLGEWRHWVDGLLTGVTGCGRLALQRTHFPCRRASLSTGAGQCLHRARVCDFQPNCDDFSHSDELGCDGQTPFGDSGSSKPQVSAATPSPPTRSWLPTQIRARQGATAEPYVHARHQPSQMTTALLDPRLYPGPRPDPWSQPGVPVLRPRPQPFPANPYNPYKPPWARRFYQQPSVSRYPSSGPAHAQQHFGAGLLHHPIYHGRYGYQRH